MSTGRPAQGDVSVTPWIVEIDVISGGNAQGPGGSVVVVVVEEVDDDVVVVPVVENVCPGFTTPKLAVAGAFHVKSPYVVPVPVNWSDSPASSLAASAAPMSVDVCPDAGPLVAVNDPSYDRNCTTPLGETKASPSGDPFWRPRTGTTANP